ncbi:MAG: TIGR01212 family radical SAM protein [Planctomycetes bacterium]|nr:TIGR01212 family radical SAM protein [Planctomycetota bacterium]
MQTATPELTREPYYKPFSRLMKELFGEPVYKVTLDAGFTCPNIDGTKATGGCTFCDNVSFSPALRNGSTGIAAQLEKGARFYREKFGARRFLAYFQAFTNTYAPIEKLRAMWDAALAHPDVCGISVGTRPDCVDAAKLQLLQTYADGSAAVWQQRLAAGTAPTKLPYVCIEYGMQTMHDATAERVNRAHTHAETVTAVELTRRHAPAAHLCLHLIAGLPGETPAMVRQSIAECARLRPDSIKFHHAYVYENTVMAAQFRAGEFTMFDLDTHVGLAADCIEAMAPGVCVERLVGELTDPGVIAPLWGKSKLQIYRLISDELRRRGTCQGARRQG